MTDHNQLADDELLSAYLAGELDAAQSADFETRLAAEPDLAAQADALAGALAAFSGADSAAMPEGFEQRLEQRLAAERAAGSTDGVPADLGAYRERRNRSRVWLGVGTAAAVLVATAVMAGPVLRQVSGGGASDAAGTAEETALEAPAQDMQAPAEAGAARPDGPVILDEQVAVADEDALTARYSDTPEAAAVLGLPLSQARPLARRYTELVATREIATASALRAGDGAEDTAAVGGGDDTGEAQTEAAAAAPPAATAGSDRCLSAITSDARAPLVPVRVETLRYDGADALAYVLVTVSPQSRQLDRTEVWVVSTDDCSTLVFQQY